MSVIVAVSFFVSVVVVMRTRQRDVTMRHFVPTVFRVPHLAMPVKRAAHENVQPVFFGIKNDWKWDVQGALSFSPKVDVVSVCNVVDDEWAGVKTSFLLQLVDALKFMGFRRFVAVVLCGGHVPRKEAKRQKK